MVSDAATDACRQRTRSTPGLAQAAQIKASSVDRLFLVGVYILLAIFLLIVSVPLLYILASSSQQPDAVIAGRVSSGRSISPSRGYQARSGESEDPHRISATRLFYTRPAR